MERNVIWLAICQSSQVCVGLSWSLRLEVLSHIWVEGWGLYESLELSSLLKNWCVLFYLNFGIHMSDMTSLDDTNQMTVPLQEWSILVIADSYAAWNICWDCWGVQCEACNTVRWICTSCAPHLWVQILHMHNCLILFSTAWQQSITRTEQCFARCSVLILAWIR